MLAAGATTQLVLDNYYFDSNHSDAQVTWTATGQQTVTVDINQQSNVATITAPGVITNQIEIVTFTVTDPADQSTSDEIRVTLVPEGGVVIDFSAIGGMREIGVGVPDTLDLMQFLVVGSPDDIVWTAQSQDAQTVLAQVLDKTNLQTIGFREGESDVVITATNIASVQSSTGSVRVIASRSSNPGELSVRYYGALTLQ